MRTCRSLHRSPGASLATLHLRSGTSLTKYLFQRRVRLGRSQSLRGRQENVDFSYPAEVEQFRAELRDVAVRESDRRADRRPPALRPRRRDIRDAARVEPHDGRRRLGGRLLAARVRWPRRDGARTAGLRRGDHRARVPVPLNVIGINNIAPAIMQYGTDAQKRDAAPPHAARRRHLVPGHVRTRGGFRPRLAAHPRGRATATTSSSTARRSGPRSGTAPTGACSTCAPIPTRPKHKGISCLIVDMTLPGIEVRPLVTSTATRTSPRCSSPTCGSRRERCSAR